MDPSKVFSTFGKDQLAKIHRYFYKERLKISKLTEFESDMSQTSEDIAPQSREILQSFLGCGDKLCPLPPPSTTQTSTKFCDFVEPYLC